MRRTLFVLALLLLGTAGVASGSTRTKPTTHDYDRVQLAGRAAFGKLHLVDQRGCDRADLRCVDAATGAEISAYERAVDVERSVAHLLRLGKCRTAMLNRSGQNAEHVGNVRRARSYWHARNFAAAARSYYARFGEDGRYDAQFERYC
jgi:hypothetical protein